MKTLKMLYLLMIVFLFVGCGSEDEQAVTSSTAISTNMSDYSIISSLGLDTTSIVDKGDYYLVEGDIALYKESLKGYVSISGQSKLRQGVVTGRLVSQSKVANITVRIDNGIPTSGSGGEWRNAVSSAIEAWNSVPNCLVNFSLTTASSADITVKIGHNDDPQTIAWTFLPSGSNPPSELDINDLIFDTFPYKTNTITHELGHTIGLLHAHASPTSQDNNGVTIPGTPDMDYESIMSKYRDRTLSPGFSYYDVIAVQYLYPKSELNIVPSIINTCSGNSISYTLSNFSGTVNWTAVENSTLTSGQGTNMAIFNTSGNGFVKVGASYYFSGNYFALSNNSSVWVGKPAFPTITTLSKFYANSSYEVYATPTSPGSTYTWVVTGATIVESSDNMIVIKANNYYNDASSTIKVTVTNDCGSVQTTKTVPIKGTGGGVTPEI